MRFLDALKMALHNIWHNKSRTALTVIIVLIVGTLLMVLNIFAISFYNNMNDVSKIVFNEKGTTYSFQSYYDRNGNGSYYTQAEFDVFFNSLDKYSAYVDSVEVRGQSSDGSFSTDLTLADKTSAELMQNDNLSSQTMQVSLSSKITSFIIPAAGGDGFILEGRPWTKKDRGTGNIWVTDTFVEEIFKEQKLALRAGDELSYIMYYSVNSGGRDGMWQSSAVAKKVTICGIMDSQKINASADNYYQSSTGYFMDAEFCINAAGAENMYFYNISMSYMPAGSDYDFVKTYNDILAFEDSINSSSAVRQPDYGFLAALFGGKRMSSEITSMLSMARMMGGVVIGLILVISLVIVLLSAGSIANSIIISTDKNKKFIGLMKALGLKNKGVNQIINIEAAAQILIGIAVSFLALYLLKGLLLNILTVALGSIFRSIASGVEYTLTLNMPVYVPVAVFLVFLAFALLSARGSLKKLGQMDVIAIMSEAA